MNNAVRKTFDLRSLSELALVYAVLCVSIGAFVILQHRGLDAIAPWFLPDSAQQLLQSAQLWRLWTPTFVHYTFIHLATNAYIWWLFASKIERRSRFELIVVVVIAAAAANALQWWAAGPQFGGLSGLVYALLSYCWLVHRFGGVHDYRIDPILGLMLLALLPLAATGLLGKFANFAHLGGLLSGAVLAALHIKLQPVEHEPKHRDC